MQNILAEAMIEENSIHEPRSPLDWVVSIILHFVVLAFLLLLPLYFTSKLDIQRFNLTFLAAPMAPAAPPPPPHCIIYDPRDHPLPPTPLPPSPPPRWHHLRHARVTPSRHAHSPLTN